MLYQLPSGKVIYLTIEEFLSMSDQDFHEITNSGIGEDPSYNHSFAGGNSRGKNKIINDDEEEINEHLDFIPDDDETDTTGPIDYSNLEEQ